MTFLKPFNQIKLFGLGNFFIELVNLEKKNILPNKIILSGQKGLGKSTMAFHLVNYILSKDEEFKYDLENFEINQENHSFKTILNRSNPNFILIDILSDKKVIDITQIRELISKLTKSSFNEKPRFVLIDNIEFLNINSINALLKILEEPPVGVYFLLIADELNNILPTIQSRSQKVFFRNLTLDECKNIITLNNSIINKENLDDIIKLSNYSPGLSLEINSFSGLSIYQELLNTFINKQTIRDFSKKIVSTSKNNLSNIWIVEFLIKKLLSNCLRYSINKESINNSLILNENQIIKTIQKNKNNNDLLDILDDLNYRIKRVKNFNLSLELEVFQFLNQFH